MTTVSKTTGNSIRQPNFFIVGASRAGTTSLWHYLRQHPDIFMPEDMLKKEPSFFCDLTPPWAVNYRDFDSYVNLFVEAKNQKAIGEASTTYLVSPESADRINKLYPEAKIIIILRHPVERAFSLYSLLCHIGVEWIAPFEMALVKENERYENDYFKHNNPFWYYAYLYFHSGLYAAQIERYLRVFPKEQIHILLFEELKNRPIETTQGVYEFLGVESGFVPVIKVHNRSKSLFSVYAQYFVWQTLNSYLSKLPIPGRIAKGITKTASSANLTLGRIFSGSLKENTRRSLLMRYWDDIQKTKGLIGVDLDSWLMKS